MCYEDYSNWRHFDFRWKLKKVYRDVDWWDETKMQAKFQCKKTFDWNFHYCHIADDYNNFCHASPGLEETWIKAPWIVCALAFLLAMTEVNLYLVMGFFVWKRDKGKFYILKFLHQSCYRTNWWTHFETVQGSSGKVVDNALQWTHPLEFTKTYKCFRRGRWDCSNKHPHQIYKYMTFGNLLLLYFGERIHKDCHGQHKGMDKTIYKSWW